MVCEDDGNGNYNKDANGDPEAISFYASDNSTTAVSKVTTGTDGKVTIYGLPTDNTNTATDAVKTYHLVEVKAPKGYQLQTRSVMFTIDRQGNVKVKNADGSYDTVSDKTVTMADVPIKLYLQKLGESDTVSGKGAVFTLTDTCSSNSAAGTGDGTTGNGVGTTATASCDGKLADGESSKELKITADDGKLLLPIESLVAGHTYKLKETTAAAGYQADAEVVFHVAEDGTKIDSIVSTTGGYLISENKCATLDDAQTTIKIYDKRVGITLTKKDAETNNVLAGAEFTLQPYESSGADTTTGSGTGTGTGVTAGSAFGEGYSRTEVGTGSYNSSINSWTFTTDSKGKFTIPGGLLLHNRSYLLKETKAVNNYYVAKELADGVILQVDDTGKVSLKRLNTYQTVSGVTCPLTLATDANGTGTLTAVNTQYTSFTLTKRVEGNMSDKNGTFEIKLSVYEPGSVQNATTLIAQKTIKLKADETYDSVTGLISQAGSSTGSSSSSSAGSSAASGASDSTLAFGKDAIPKGATLVIEETGDYSASVKILDAVGKTKETIKPQENVKSQIQLTLNTAGKVIIELTNTKDGNIDVGVVNERQAPLAAVALVIPAAWLFYRYRRRRRRQ